MAWLPEGGLRLTSTRGLKRLLPEDTTAALQARSWRGSPNSSSSTFGWNLRAHLCRLGLGLGSSLHPQPLNLGLSRHLPYCWLLATLTGKACTCVVGTSSAYQGQLVPSRRGEAGWSEPPAQHPGRRNPAPVILSEAEALNRPHLDQLSVGTLATPAIKALRCLLLEQLLPRQPDPTLARQPRCLQPSPQGKYAHLPPVACSCDPASPSSCPVLCPWLPRPKPWVHAQSALYQLALGCPGSPGLLGSSGSPKPS